MLKPVDVVILYKLIIKFNKNNKCSHQKQLAKELKVSVSTINKGLKKLKESQLIHHRRELKPYWDEKPYCIIRNSCMEFFKYAVPYAISRDFNSYKEFLPSKKDRKAFCKLLKL